MVVEPPGDFGGTGILEVYDRIFVAIKMALIEQGSGAMQQSAVNEFDIIADALSVKPGEEGCG